eukprot:TRINITY_DN1483_c0_g1_i1.p1 TRINITY_DN1483_c0_g1~~TRINITY_DN1483_c0_g1_i1.p1  ORF type:complete len:464 (-),score=123.71 TRINITY_DN1483_c0_g1_i1:159-1550(-)
MQKTLMMDGHKDNGVETWHDGDDEEDVEENGEGPQSGRQLMDLLQSQLQEGLKTKERYDRLVARYNQLKKAKEDVDVKLETSIKKNEELTAQNKGLEGQLQSQKDKTGHVSSTLQEITANRDALAQDKARLEAALKQANQDKDELKDKLASTTANKIEVEQKHNEYVKSATADRGQLESRLKALTHQADDLSVSCQKLTDELEAERVRRIETQRAHEMLNGQYVQRNKEAADLSLQLRDWQMRAGDHQRTQNELRAAHETNATLLELNAALRKQLEEEREKGGSNSQMMAEIRALREHMTKVAGTRGDASDSTEVSELQIEIKKIKRENDELQNKLEAVVENVSTNLVPPMKEKEARRIAAGKRPRKPMFAGRPRVAQIPSSKLSASSPSVTSLPTTPVSSRSFSPRKAYTPNPLAPKDPKIEGEQELILIDFLENMRSPQSEKKAGRSEKRTGGATPKKLEF